MTQTFAHLTDSEFLLFQKILVDEGGLYFDRDKIHALEPVLAERLKQHHCSSYQGYYEFLKSHSEGRKEIRELLDLLTIGETFFFRGAPHFDALMKTVLPEIIRRKAACSRESLVFWSAGCSRGDEPYSLAIAVMETLPDWRKWDVSILGTDINRQALVFAREGVYSSRDVAELRPDYLERYFKKSGPHFIVNEDVKRLVRFQDHNLARDPFFAEGMQGCDIIFCRNVTIYFDFPTTQRVINQFYDCLLPEGYLFIGYAETLWQVTDRFQTVEFPQAFIYKKPLAGFEKEEPRPFMGVPALEIESPRVKKTMSADISTHLERANILANEGKYPEAIAELTVIIGRDNLCAEAYYLLGVLKYRIGDLEGAQDQFKKAVYADPEIVLSYYNLGNIYLYQRKFSSAQREFRNALRFLSARPRDEKIRLCEDYTVEFLTRACKNNLDEICRGGHG